MTDEKKIPDHVLWIDPGLHVGWAMLLGGEHFETGQVHGRLEAADFLHEKISTWQNMHVGWEAYITGHSIGGVGDPAPAHEVIGVARWLTHHHGGTLLPPVPAANRVVATQAALKGMGWQWRGDHSLSASQHLLAWCLRERYLAERTKAVYQDLLIGLDKFKGKL